LNLEFSPPIPYHIFISELERDILCPVRASDYCSGTAVDEQGSLYEKPSDSRADYHLFIYQAHTLLLDPWRSLLL
jgi:hypothetical protein